MNFSSLLQSDGNSNNNETMGPFAEIALGLVENTFNLTMDLG